MQTAGGVERSVRTTVPERVATGRIDERPSEERSAEAAWPQRGARVRDLESRGLGGTARKRSSTPGEGIGASVVRRSSTRKAATGVEVSCERGMDSLRASRERLVDGREGSEHETRGAEKRREKEPEPERTQQ